jgi:hypothetical protein
MSSTDRQNRLLIAEDWKKIYQSYRNAEFRSYDFDSLRRAMISYLRTNYPEDFNDYIDTSEYLALIDIIAFLGQNVSYRVDLNARENYLELAERRESVLRLARMLSYNPKRNLPANGLLKFETISTTEEIIDSNGFNLSDQTIIWNDPSNSNWSEQFRRVLNASLPQNGTIGKPAKNGILNGVQTQQYRFRSTNLDLPVYSFNKAVNGIQTAFEIVSTDIDLTNSVIKEENPVPGNSLAFLYREDGRGNNSSNTGYFMHFTQGTLNSSQFSVGNATANQRISIDTENINNNDVWLYQLNDAGQEDVLWSKVSSTEGNNAIYNSVSKGVRNYYVVQTRERDQISLIFADGTFGNLPQGNFRVYYRTSSNRSLRIKPSELTGITVSFDYISKTGSTETLTIGLELKDNITNASTSESTPSIRQNAPQTYYTQNRMITGEDYNIVPLSINQEIIKVQSTNRVSSGISRYFDLKDVTGKYSSTNLYGSDGLVYKELYEEKRSFTFNNQTDIEGTIENTVLPIIQNRNINNFYFANYAKIIVSDLNARWVQSTKATNTSTGYLVNASDVPYQTGTFTGGSLKYLEPGALLKFIPPAGFYFIGDGELTSDSSAKGAQTYKWVQVVSVNGSGTQEDSITGEGPIRFNAILPKDSVLDEVKPKLVKDITQDVKSQMIDQIFAYKTFGLRYDQVGRQWRIIINENLNVFDQFSNGKTGDVTNNQLDASWLILFQTNGEKYTITNRGLRYIFESDKEISFYYDGENKVYDSASGKLVKDKITILNINTKPDQLVSFNSDINWEIVNSYKNADGYINGKKVEVSFYDQNDDGNVDDPDIFDIVVNPNEEPLTKYVFLKKENTDQGYANFQYYTNSQTENLVKVVSNQTEIGPYADITEGQIFYIQNLDIFYVFQNNTLNISSDYKAFIGRADMKFHYVHSADESNRIDPSASNIIDVYMLTKAYDIDFRKYISGSISDKPKPLSSDELFQNYGLAINQYKSVSDEVIYHPVIYKTLFGNKSDDNLQATFKIVKNSGLVINDNDLKARVISSINKFFALQNWDFGESFFFTEMVTYIMNENAPDISNLVIVPKQGQQSFGSLFEIKCEDYELFISDATVDDVEIIDSITASRLQASGKVVTATNSSNTGIISRRLSTTTTTSTTTSTTTTSSSSSSSTSGGGTGY